MDCWSGEGYVATGLELKAFPFVDEGSLISDCANCLNKIIRRTQNRRGHEIRFEAAHQIRRKEWKAVRRRPPQNHRLPFVLPAS